jgi:hypothetical protein
MQSHWVQAPSIHLSVYVYIYIILFFPSFLYIFFMNNLLYTNLYIYKFGIYIYIQIWYLIEFHCRQCLLACEITLFLGTPNPSSFTLNLNPKTLH